MGSPSLPDLLEELRARGASERTLAAMAGVDRALFVPEKLRREAYRDVPLPIGEGQTISAPHMVAILCDLLELAPGHKVLEVGGGSGYQAAVMARLAAPGGRLYTVEILPALAERARANLRAAGVSNATVVVGDGSLGLPERAPFDRIAVACSAPDIPPPLLEQLTRGGRMAIPVGRVFQELLLVVKEDGAVRVPQGGVAFVPLVGKFGFRE
ncbi:MAG: protein-L-isoaspartate(D-aspartate) O-methyltransferase [Halobacteria archaeon]